MVLATYGLTLDYGLWVIYRHPLPTYYPYAAWAARVASNG